VRKTALSAAGRTQTAIMGARVSVHRQEWARPQPTQTTQRYGTIRNVANSGWRQRCAPPIGPAGDTDHASWFAVTHAWHGSDPVAPDIDQGYPDIL